MTFVPLPDAEELNFVGLRRQIRAKPGTTVGGDANSVWYTFQVDAGTTGVHRVMFRTDLLDSVRVQAKLYRQEGPGLADLKWADAGNVVTSTSPRFSKSMFLNCEGYHQGRSGDDFWEFAVAGDERYYIQVSTLAWPSGTPMGADFTIQWYYDPWDPLYFMTGAKVSSPCTGVELDTHGFEIRYVYAAYSGWAQRFVPGSGDRHNLPALPVDGHAFYAERTAEGLNVHIQRLVIGWTEASGPFLYGYLDPKGRVRTWSIDNEDPYAGGTGDGDGRAYVPINFYDNHFYLDSGEETHPALTMRRVSGARSEVDTTWASAMVGTGQIFAFVWGGPNRPDSIFGMGGATITEFALDGAVIATYDLYGFEAWPSEDGTELFGHFTADPHVSTNNLVAYNTTTGGFRTLVGSIGGAVLGVRSSNSEIVLVTASIVCVNPVTGATRTFPLPPLPAEKPAAWSAGWRTMGVTWDGQHLFLAVFYPLSYLGHGNRDFVTDVWWMDLDTGVAERKFMMAEPFHDTFDVTDKVFQSAIAEPVGRRLYKQSDVGG